jgi:beta-glucosidase
VTTNYSAPLGLGSAEYTGSAEDRDDVAFPDGFRWGAATAAYQIEGAAAEDGRTPSIWDTFSHTPGAVAGGDTGDVACDHYHRMPADVALMSRMGLPAYRFSVSWSRLQPHGRGPLNPAGVDFYKRLLDELGGHGIEPWLTLYHWDLPQELEDAGGWPVRETAYRFADFAASVHQALGDRVQNWTTMNEPWCSAFLGYGDGHHAPGRTNRNDALAASHHLMLGHGLAVAALRAQQHAGDRLGVTLNLYAVSPATASSADAEAARRIDGLMNRWFLDPILRGTYPADVTADLRTCDDLRFIRDGDVAAIAAPLDFLGVNYYTRHVVAAPPDGVWSSEASSTWPGSEQVRFVDRGLPVTEMNWEIDPDGLVEVLTRVHREYTDLPLYVTENGAACDDQIGPDGTVRDPDRIGFVDAHLRACHRAVTAGVPLRGYFAWSLLDNFEWGWGYGKRFGMVYVDYPTQRRIIKSSATWYSDVIARNGLPRRR